MHAISLTRPSPGFVLDICELLSILGPVLPSAFWQILPFENEGSAVGDAFDTAATAGFDSALTSRARLSTPEFESLCGELRQVVWGEFRAFRSEADEHPFLIIIVVDSSFVDLFSVDPRAVDLVRPYFDCAPPRLDTAFYGALVQ